MYAIIATGGKQYKVSEGDIITIEKLGVEAGEKVTFDQVLVVGGDDLKVGDPTVAGATVEASVVKEGNREVFQAEAFGRMKVLIVEHRIDG